MYTPHPSLVPMEMARPGMLTVTNTFENKTAEKLAAISPNLIAAEPTSRRRGGAGRGRRARRATSSARLRGSARALEPGMGGSFAERCWTRVLSLLAG